MSPAGQYFIDGKDFWTLFSIMVESGSDDFLKYPSKKDSITRNWSDADGTDVDLSAVYFNSRDISLRCAMLADSETDFWTKYEAFINQWKLPGSHRIEVSEFGLRSFYCYYRDTSQFTRFTRVRDGNGQIKIACKFTLNITESEPQLNSNNVFIITQDNRFLIT
jgi:hypothetical protein